MQDCISRLVRVNLLVLLLLSAALSFAATQGIFSGKIVSGPDSNRQWIYVQGPRGTVRRVDVSHANISYSSQVPSKDRVGRPQDELRDGAQVRVTAMQDDSGEWKATSVRILALATKPPVRARTASY